MGNNIVHKVFQNHIVEGNLRPGTTVAVKVDQTLTHDHHAPVTLMQFEEMGVSQIETELSVNYIDRKVNHKDPETDVEQYIETVSRKFGAVYSPAGNGISHQVHLERFAAPNKILLGTDEETITAGALGALALPAGTLDVASSMAGYPFYLTMPRVIKVELKGTLKPMVSAKDVILELLALKTTKGNEDKVLEFGGEGVLSLSISERSTIANMSSELGVRACIFPSDRVTRAYLKSQNREEDWEKLEADQGADYYDVISLDLSEIEPMVAVPHSPDNVCRVSDLEGLPFSQVCIGGGSNSSLKDILTVARILKGNQIAPDVKVFVTCGTKQVYEMAKELGALDTIEASGARVAENIGDFSFSSLFTPPDNCVSLWTNNCNKLGVSGNKSARVYLVSPETAVFSAISGELTDPQKFSKTNIRVPLPKNFSVNAEVVIPEENKKSVRVIRNLKISPLPKTNEIKSSLTTRVVLKLGDKISEDQVKPKEINRKDILDLKKFSKDLFESVDPEFYTRVKKTRGGVIVAGDDYGFGSLSDQAVLGPLQLGIKMILAKSFDENHRLGLIHAGIIPAYFVNPEDHDLINSEDTLKFKKLKESLAEDKVEVKLNGEKTFEITFKFSPRELAILDAGGLLNFVKQERKQKK